MLEIFTTLANWLTYDTFNLPRHTPSAEAIFGAIMPFCSCSSIPLFMGVISAGGHHSLFGDFAIDQ